VKKYNDYQSYINHQKEKTSDPEKRKIWLNEEWDTKISAFKKEFSKLGGFLTEDKKCLCLGARTGQEVVALKEMGVSEVVGIDIVPNEPYVIEGDVHNLDFEDNSFDFVYTNILNHSFDPKKMIAEAERVLKPDGLFLIQTKAGENQDEYSVFEISHPVYDVVTLFDQSYCLTIQKMDQEVFYMNLELLFTKDKNLSKLFKKYGNLKTISVPEKYEKIWNEINLPIQNKKLTNHKILDPIKRRTILESLMKRAYYLTRISKIFEAKNILEVGTAEGWQFFSFGEYAKEVSGSVYSCDPRDVRNKKYIEVYRDVCTFYQSDSKFMSEQEVVKDIDMFYIDGLHDENTVIADVLNLLETQGENPVWVFDDYDVRFGCHIDINTILTSSRGFKVWNVGLTASGSPCHQAMVNTKFALK